MEVSAQAVMHATPVVEVVAAVIIQADGQFLLAQRPEGKVYAGYWEFPGGKVEPGESPMHALERELWEELAIQVRLAYPWITKVFEYPHATVRLNFFRVVAWEGMMIPRENQSLCWQLPRQVTVTPVLPANDPILRALSLPPVYAVTNASGIGIRPALDKIERALSQGVRLLQIREKQMAKAELKRFAGDVLSMAHRAQAKVLINGDLALARELGADGVHLTASQLMALPSRPDPDDGLCGASCHNSEELVAAERLGLDFAVLGPVQPTLTHPGMPPLGWRRFAALIRGYSLPVYALGGLCSADLAIAQEFGAHGIAMMRGIGEPNESAFP